MAMFAMTRGPSRKPAWAALSANNMEKMWIPASVAKLAIYADHDESYTGQAAAYALAKRIKIQAKRRGPREVAVYVPRHADTDWADVLLERLAQAA